MAPTNIKTVHQPFLLHIESNLDQLGLLSPTHDQRPQQQSGQITLRSVLINKSKFLKATHRTEVRKIELPRSMAVKALSWWCRRASQHPAVRSPLHPCKRPTNLALLEGMFNGVEAGTVVANPLYCQEEDNGV